MKKSLKRIFDITVYSGFIISIASHIIINNSNILNNNKITLKNISESTQVSDLNKSINELEASHEEYQNYIQTKKTNLATAITNAGVTTSGNDTFETMIANVSNIITNKTGDATATASQILSGQTAYAKGEKITGTMTNRGAWTSTSTSSEKVTIPEGYHNGNGYVDTYSVYNQGWIDGKQDTMNNLDVQYTYHQHTGNPSTVGGCYGNTSVPCPGGVYATYRSGWSSDKDCFETNMECNSCRYSFKHYGNYGYSSHEYAWDCDRTTVGIGIICGKNENTIESVTIKY